MKRILYVAAALLLAACSREVLPEPAQPEENQEAKTYTVTLTASFDPETRLSISESSGSGLWAATDEIAIFTRNGNLVKGTIKDGDHNINNSKFTFEIETGDAIEDGAIAYYPYSIAVAGNSNQIRLPDTFNSPTVQYMNIPMKAVVSNNGTDLSFKHLASMVLVPIPGTPSYPGTKKNPSKILFETNNPISGLFNVAGTADNPTLSPVSGNTGNTITSNFWVAGEKHMYILPAGTYDGFSISIKNNDGFILYKKNRSSSFTATRAKLVKMPALDVEDYKGFAFYLTGNETGWSTSATAARMIQVGKNSFKGAMYSSTGSQGNSDLGFKIIPGNQMGNWNYVIGASGDYKATYGESGGNFNASTGVYSVQITFGSAINGNYNPWDYSISWVSDDNYLHENLYLVGGFGTIQMSAPVRHNWVAEVTVAAGTSFEPNQDYWWKINNGGWGTQWGNGIITDEQLYCSVAFDSNSQNGSINLKAGTYDVFFNDAIGQIMFVKK